MLTAISAKQERREVSRRISRRYSADLPTRLRINCRAKPW